jgi:hypothetical protein
MIGILINHISHPPKTAVIIPDAIISVEKSSGDKNECIQIKMADGVRYDVEGTLESVCKMLGIVIQNG